MRNDMNEPNKSTETSNEHVTDNSSKEAVNENKSIEDWAVIKHIAELADKHCPDLGTKHDARPALEVIESYIQQSKEEERDIICCELLKDKKSHYYAIELINSLSKPPT